MVASPKPGEIQKAEKKKGKEQPLKEKRLVVFGRGHNGES